MSQIVESQSGVELRRDLTLPEIYKLEDKKSIVWHKPKSDVLVAGSTRDEYGKEAPGDNIIVNLKTHLKAKQEWRDGKRSWDNYITAGYSQEWESSAFEFKDALDKSQTTGEDLLEAAVIRPEHFAALQTSEINELIIAIEQEPHVLLGTINTINMDKLNERVILEIKDDQTKLVTRNVGEEGLPTEIGPYQWRQKTLGLQLNGTKAVFAGTMRLTAFDVDVMAPFVQIMMNAILRDKHQMIAEIFNDGTGFDSDAIAIDWDAVGTNGRPDAYAYKDMQAQFREIALQKKGQANWVISNLLAYEAYRDNSRLLGQDVVAPFNNNNAEPETNFVDNNPPRLPGRRWGVDDLLDDDTVWTFNSRAIYFAQGPRRSSSLNNDITGNFGTVNLEYYKATLVFPELIKKYTGITT